MALLEPLILLLVIIIDVPIKANGGICNFFFLVSIEIPLDRRRNKSVYY
jgi:hypothetical protein